MLWRMTIIYGWALYKRLKKSEDGTLRQVWGFGLLLNLLLNVRDFYRVGLVEREVINDLLDPRGVKLGYVIHAILAVQERLIQERVRVQWTALAENKSCDELNDSKNHR